MRATTPSYAPPLESASTLLERTNQRSFKPAYERAFESISGSIYQGLTPLAFESARELSRELNLPM